MPWPCGIISTWADQAMRNIIARRLLSRELDSAAAKFTPWTRLLNAGFQKHQVHVCCCALSKHSNTSKLSWSYGCAVLPYRCSSYQHPFDNRTPRVLLKVFINTTKYEVPCLRGGVKSLSQCVCVTNAAEKLNPIFRGRNATFHTWSQRYLRADGVTWRQWRARDHKITNTWCLETPFHKSSSTIADMAERHRPHRFVSVTGKRLKSKSSHFWWFYRIPRTLSVG
mgnify:CR=1 FL=1